MKILPGRIKPEKTSGNFLISDFYSPLFKLLLSLLFLGTTFFVSAADWYPGRLLVKPKSGASLQEFHRACASTLKMKIMAGDEAWELVEFDPLENVADKARSYLKSGLVEYAHPDYLVKPALMPNDTYIRDPKRAYNIQLINAPAAWNLHNSASNVIVAVVDTGVRYTHEDLAPNMWVNTKEIPNNKIDDDLNGYVDDVYGVDFSEGATGNNPMDTSGHGTHVAGIIGACGNNAKGVCGIAWNVKIMACRFQDDTGGHISDAVRSMVYARENGAKIINASWTFKYDVQILKSEIQTLESRGIIVVCAADNQTLNLDTEKLYPACYSVDYQNVICVGNSDSADTKVYNSNYSTNYVQLFAPGREIYSTYANDDSRYSFLSGSSMSTPHVTGALALYLQANPSSTYTQTRTRLLASVDPVDALKNYCSTGGRLNLAKLLSSKVVPIITWPAPGPVSYGTLLSEEQLNASASTQGSFIYDPQAGILLEPGTHFLLTTFTPMDTTTYLGTDKTVALTVNKRVPVINWPEPKPIVYGTKLSAEQLNATADTAGSFLYSPSKGTLLNAGTHNLKVTFIPTDNTHYTTKDQTVSLTVEKARPEVLWPEPSPILQGTPLSENELNATANIPGAFTYDPTLETLLPLGTHILNATFTPEDSVNYETLTYLTNSLTVVSYFPDPHPADLTSSFILSPSDFSNYASHWMGGQPWSLAPNPIPVDYVTRAGFLSLIAAPYTQNIDFEPPLCWVPVSSPASPSGGISIPFATSTLSSNSVSIRLIADSATLCWALEETLPLGAIPSEIGQAGAHDSAHNQVKWGPYSKNGEAPNEQIFSYNLTAEEGFAGLVTLSGVLSMDGVSIPVLGERRMLLGARVPNLHCTATPPGKITLSWENLSLQAGKLQLQKSSGPNGPWEPESEALSPYIVTITPSSALYFRLAVVDAVEPTRE